MKAVRHAKLPDAPALEALLDAVPDMPERSREAARATLRAVLADGVNGARCLVHLPPGSTAPSGFVCLRPVPLSRDAFDIEWLITTASSGLEPSVVVADLVNAVRDEPSAPATLRFLSGRWQRGGLDEHVLDAAGMTRAGAIEGFYGRGDPLVVFTARGARRVDAFDPASPASLCDAAFGYRDFAFERDFLLACAARFGSRRVRRAASWGCWAGRHLHALADRGIAGVGIDESYEALALAQVMSGDDGNDDGELTKFVLGRLDDRVDEPPVDLSYAMLSAVHRVGSAESMVRHLQRVADLLAPGGVHVIEATLPADAMPDGNTQTVWTERRGQWEITSRFRMFVEQRAASGAVPTVLDVRCRRGDSQEIAGRFHQEELWIVPDADGWRALVERAGRFEVAALLGDFQLDIAWDQPGAWRMIVVLRRTEDATR
jgi:hypothetical protein